ncbi:uncharacterized protein V6R79_000388 [Siganus canaliculatus]
MDKSSVSTTVNQEESSDSEKCYICLNSFDKQAVASLENCLHLFCLECILQWSQTANTCPVDRIPFTCIHQRRSPGGDIQKKINVKAPKHASDDEEDEGRNAVICEECGRSDRSHRLLVCTQCDSGYHIDCLRPPVNTEGEWICPECAAVPQHPDGSVVVVEEDISDGELMDLLAEVDEAPSTSSRLRPSTVRRPRSSADRRRSRRIQSRASVDPDPRPQISWHVPKYLLKASKPAASTDAAAAPQQSDAKLKAKRKRKRAP